MKLERRPTLEVEIPYTEDLPSPQPSPRKSVSPPAERRKSSKSSSATRGALRLLSDGEHGRELAAARKLVYEHLESLEPIPELSYTPKARFAESTKKKVLEPLIRKANCLMVAGGFFGDEGKGKTVDAIAVHPSVKLVARVNSGENAGHTVIGPDGTKYAFNLCPSGVLTPGKVNAIGPECVMDPVSFVEKEISQLTRDKVDYKDRLLVGNCHIVCPHHKLLDLMNSWKAPNLSTIMGMGPVHASKAKRKGLRMDHIFGDRADSKRRLEADLFDYYGTLKNLGITETQLYDRAKENPKVQKHVLDFIQAPDKADYLFKLYDKYVVENPNFPNRADVSHLLRETIRKGGKVLLEGPQSYWLSNAAEKFWDSGTSANTCAAGMLAASRLNLTGLRTVVINIHKTPGSSRVGSGANPVAFAPQDFFAKTDAKAEDFDSLALDWREVSNMFFNSVQANGIVKPGIFTTPAGGMDLGVAMAAASCVHPSHSEFGVTSGRPRVVGFFDCVAHAEAMAAQGPYCSISAVDRGDDYDEYGICIAYVFHHPDGKSMVSNGRTFESGTIIKAGDQLPTQQILHFCHPIIKKVKGWRDTPIYARSDWWQNRKAPIEMPKAICEMLDIIEQFTGAKIVSIGNGARGEDIIYLKRLPDEEGGQKAKAKSKAKGKAKSKAAEAAPAKAATAKGKAKAKAKAGAEATQKGKTEERRVDPEDGQSYSFSELSAYYAGKYKKKAIEEYWESTCKPAKSKSSSGRRR
mmetsp:Transcript_25656/g.55770  ORF Transcript_25656/g.55770 Transcript_25656/m.55770 type:complete len:749 (+) Transcript_25656:324-2570(+)